MNAPTIVLILTLTVLAPGVGIFAGWLHHRLNCPVHRKGRP